jgi:Tol biopolymer transport system component
MAPLAVSPDGQRLVFGAKAAEGKRFLYLRAFAESEAQKLPGTEDAIYPFWSPDSRAVGFFTYPEGKLKRIGISGASAQALCDAPEARGGSWGADDVILFGTLNGPLYRVSSGGGQPSAATHLDSARREADHRWPQFLPGGRRFLYLVRTAGESRNMTLMARSLDSPTIKVVGKVASSVVYAPPGYLLSTTVDRTLVAQPFDVRGGRLFGSAVSVAEQVLVIPQRWTAAFSVSPAGVLAYEAGPQAEPTKFAWFDRSGKRLETLSPLAEYGYVALSPDGAGLATQATDTRTGTDDLWLYDFARGTSTRLTFDPADDGSPVWSPDGRQIAFSSNRKGVLSLYVKPVNGATPEESLVEADRETSPMDWSFDGRFLLYTYRRADGKQALWALPMTGERKPFPVLQTPFDENDARFSPDGRSIVYVSDESGRYEVYVQAFPRTGERWQVSIAGGRNPRWRRDGGELFYVAPDGQIMAVGIHTQPAFAASTPRRLFPNPASGPFAAYDVTRDGERFLFVVPDRETPKPPISLVFNWLPESKR